MTEYEVRRIRKVKDGYYDELIYKLRVSPAFLWFFGIEVGIFIMGIVVMILLMR